MLIFHQAVGAIIAKSKLSGSRSGIFELALVQNRRRCSCWHLSQIQTIFFLKERRKEAERMAREREELRRQQEQLRFEQEKRNNLKRGREVEHGYLSFCSPSF